MTDRLFLLKEKEKLFFSEAPDGAAETESG